MLGRTKKWLVIAASPSTILVRMTGEIETTETSWIGFHVSVRSVAVALSCVIAVLVVSGALANWMIYNVAPDPEHFVADVLRRFDLGHEPSIPAFYSASMMLACCCLLVVIGRSAHEHRRSWYLLALALLAMALDEAVMFHEMVDTAVKMALPTSGIFYFAWVIPGLVVVVLFGLVFLKFLLALDRATSWRFVVSGLVFVFGAVGMEMVAGVIFDSSISEEEALRSVAHVLSQAVEEGLEMAGIAVFFVALLDYVQRRANGLQFPLRKTIEKTLGEVD